MTTNQPTAISKALDCEKFIKIAHSFEFLSAVKQAKIARGLERQEAERVNRIGKEILEVIVLRDDEGQRIINPEEVWQAIWEDQAALEEYFERRDARHKADGYKLEPGVCPHVLTRQVANRIENRLIKLGWVDLGYSYYPTLLSHRDELVKLLLAAGEAAQATAEAR